MPKFNVTVVETITRTRTKVFEATSADEAFELADIECDDMLGSIDDEPYWDEDEDAEDDITERVVDEVEEVK